MNNKSWLRLDNSAKIFPFLMDNDNQNLFRLSVELNEKIDQEILQEALNQTIKRFPSFAVKLMRGVFWYYFEHNEATPIVKPESDIIMEKITPYNCNGFCFRITYYENRITAEFYHVICDGTGALEFMKSLLYSYLSLKGYNITSDSKILTIDTPIDPRELEDSFVANYKPKKLRDLNISGLTGKTPAFAVSGAPFATAGKGVINADINVKEILKYCKAHGWTLTQFLGGLFMYSVYMTKGKFAQNPNDVVLFVPMNLRKTYQSITLRNFTLFSRIRVSMDSERDIPLETFVEAVKFGLKEELDRTNLDNKIGTAVLGEKFWLMRILPLCIKSFVFSIANKKGKKAPTKTATFSNVGIVDLPESFKPYVKKFVFMLHSYSKVPISFTAITTYDTLTISFVRCIQDTKIEEFFIKYLADLGLDITVSSNYWEVEHAL